MSNKTKDKPVALALKNSKFWPDYLTDFAIPQEDEKFFYIPWEFPSKVNQKQLKSLGDSAIVHSTLDHVLLFFIKGEYKIEIYKGVLDQIIFSEIQRPSFDRAITCMPESYSSKKDDYNWNTIFKLNKLVQIDEETAERISAQYVKSNDEALDIEDYIQKERGPRFLFL